MFELRKEDILSVKLTDSPHYDVDTKIFDFPQCKELVAQLFTGFFEDILTVADKVRFSEFAVAKMLENSGRYEFFLLDLKDNLMSKLDKFVDFEGASFLSEREHLLRRDPITEGGIQNTPKSLNFEYIQNYIRDRLGEDLKEVFDQFYKVASSPEDLNLCRIIQKILSLDAFFDETNEYNCTQKFKLHQVQVLNMILSNSSKEDLVKNVDNLLTLDLKQILEHVLEAKGSLYTSYRSEDASASRLINSKDRMIDKLQDLFKRKPNAASVNIDALLKKLLLTQGHDVKQELAHHLQKGFNIYKQGQTQNSKFKELDSSKSTIQEKQVDLRKNLAGLEHSYTNDYSNDDLFERNDKMMILDQLYGLGGSQSSQAVDGKIDSLLKRSETPVFSDPKVSRIYNDTVQGEFNMEKLAKLKESTTTMRTFVNLEKMVYAVLSLMQQTRLLFDSVDSYKKKEKEYLSEICQHILRLTIQSLKEKFYYSTDIFKVIDEVFRELKECIYRQKVLRPGLERDGKQKQKVEQDVDIAQRRRIKRQIDCGLQRLSKLTGLTINRLLPSRDSTYFSTYNVEQSIRQSLRHILDSQEKNSYHRKDSNTVTDKILFYFINDKEKYKIDFFKLYVMQFTSKNQGGRIKLTELSHVEDDPYFKQEKYGHEDYRFDKTKFDRSLFDIDFDYAKIGVEFENEIENYNIPSKLLLSIFQVVAKDMVGNNIEGKQLADKSPLLISSDNLYEFLSYLRGIPTSGGVIDNRQGLEDGGTFLRQYGNDEEKQDLDKDGKGKYDIYQDLLDNYGDKSRVYDDPEHGRNKPVPRNNYLEEAEEALLNTLKKKLKPDGRPQDGDDGLRDLLNKYDQTLGGDKVDKNDLLKRQKEILDAMDNQRKREEDDRSAIESNARQIELERNRRIEEEALREEKERKAKAEREAQWKKEDELRAQRRLEEEKKEQDRRLKEQEERAERQRHLDRLKEEELLKEEKLRKQRIKDEEEKKQREADRRKEEEILKEERDRQRRADDERREKEAKDLRDRQERERIERQEQEDRERKDRDERAKRDREEREKRDQEEREKREREDHEKRLRDERDRQEREDRERREKADRERRDQEERERRENEDRERQEREANRKKELELLEEQNRIKKEKEEREANRKKELELLEEENRLKKEKEEREANRKKELELLEEQNRIKKEKEEKDANRKKEEELLKLEKDKKAQKKEDFDSDLDDINFDESNKFGDDFDDFDDDFGTGKKGPEQKKKDSPAKKVDDEIDDNFDDFDDDFDSDKKKDTKAKPKEVAPIKKDSEEDDFGDLDDNWGEDDDFDIGKMDPPQPKQETQKEPSITVAKTEASKVPDAKKPEEQEGQKKTQKDSWGEIADGDDFDNFDDFDDLDEQIKNDDEDDDDFGFGEKKPTKPSLNVLNSKEGSLEGSLNDPKKEIMESVIHNNKKDFELAKELDEKKRKEQEIAEVEDDFDDFDIDGDLNSLDKEGKFESDLDLENSDKPKPKGQPNKAKVDSQKDEDEDEDDGGDLITATNFTGGLRGLRNHSKNKNHEPSETSKTLDKNGGLKRVIYAKDAQIIDNYIGTVLGMGEEEVQEYLGTAQMSPENISMLLQEYLRIFNCYGFEYQDTTKIYELLLGFKDLPVGKRITEMEKATNELGEELHQILVESFNRSDFSKDVNLILPFMPVEDFEELYLVLMVINLEKKQIMMVSLNEDMDVDKLKSDSTSKLIQEFIYNICCKVINPNSKDKYSATQVSVTAPVMNEEVIGFFKESTEEPGLRYVFLCWLMYYENSSDTFDIPAFKRNLEIDCIDLKHATRFVATHNSMIQAEAISENIAVYAQNFIDYIQTINQTPEIQIQVVMNQDPEDQADLLAGVEDAVSSIKELLQVKDRVLIPIQLLFSEEDKTIQMLYVDKRGDNFLLELASNSQKFNLIVRDKIKAILADQKIQIQNFSEFPRHCFMSENMDIFGAVFTQLVVEDSIEPIRALKILSYNDLAFTSIASGDPNMEDMNMSQGQYEKMMAEHAEMAGYGNQAMDLENAQIEDQNQEDIDFGEDDNLDDFNVDDDDLDFQSLSLNQSRFKINA